MTMEACHVALVADCATQYGAALPAAELFRSALFSLSAAYANTFEGWGILSVAHLLVMPSHVTHPYQQALSDLSKDQREGWGRRCAHMAMGEWRFLEEVTLLAPKATCDLIAPHFGEGIKVHRPFAARKVPAQCKLLNERMAELVAQQEGEPAEVVA